MPPDPADSDSLDPRKDPRRNLFWLYVSFLGISVPKPGEEPRALMLLIAGTILMLSIIFGGMFLIFHFW